MGPSAEHAARQWLRDRGAESIPHAGGSLYDHLGRVHGRLGALGSGESVRLAGLTHAAYGTDGFAVTLLDPADRAQLRAVVGAEAEEHVHRYGGCDRDRTWPAVGGTGQVWSRFTGHAEAPAPADLRAFLDLCIVNELDVAEHDPVIAAEHGDRLRELFASWAQLASPAVVADARRVLG